MPTLNHFDYFTDIEQAFIKRRGKHLLIGPMDWALIESWQKKEIPLKIVLRAIDDVFDSLEQRNESKVSIRSLKYCSDAVEQQYQTWSKARVGTQEDTDSDDVLPESGAENELILHLSHCLEGLKNLSADLPFAETVTETVNKLEKLRFEPDVEGVENALEELDSRLNSKLLAYRSNILDKEASKRIQSEVSQFEGLTDNQEQILYCKLIKKELGIPPLSLYQL